MIKTITVSCGVEGCTRISRTTRSKICNLHYNRRLRTGTVELRERNLCKKGHDLSILGKNSQQRCKKCARLRGLRWYRKNRNKSNNSYLLKTYGISAQDRQIMLSTQNGGCAICGRKETPVYVLQVDHSHKTGKVRGLLCKFCNMHLVYTVEHSIGMIPKVLEYIKE